MPPQFQPQFENPKPYSDRKVWVLIVLGFVLIAVNACFLYRYIRPKSPLESQSSSVSTSSYKLADWKTYTNTEYGFEFKYPKNLYLGTSTNWMIKITRPEDKDVITEPVSGIWVNVKENKNNLSLIDWWNKYGAWARGGFKSNTFPVQHIKINNIDAIRISGSEGVLSIFTYLSNGTNVIEIAELTGLPADQILSTFKFISTSTPIKN